jgi:YbbR domain-containing protein
MRLEDILRSIVRNPGAKIVSLVFAILLWLHVTAQQGENQSFRVPLSLTGIPDSLTVIHDVPQFVDVSIRGPRSSLIKLRLFGRIKGTVDLSSAKKGRENIVLTPAILNLSDDFDSRDITILEPKTLSINLEQVISKSVPIRLAFKGQIPDDVIISGNPVIIPARVKIRGASSIVNAINFLSTQEIELRNRKGKITEEARIRAEGKDIEIRPDKVLVELDIHKRAVVTIPNIPPTILQDDENLDVEYTPRVVSLTIEGPEDLIKDIGAQDVSVILNITTRKPGTYNLEPEVIVPQGVDRYFLDTDSFEITISRRDSGGKSGGK